MGDYNSVELAEILDGLEPLDLRISLFRRGSFDFIVRGLSQNSEGSYRLGKTSIHKKQREALRILTSNSYDQFLYGGAAGGAKSFTGVAWVVFSALSYPNTRWFVARNELKDLTDSVMVTFGKFCRIYGIDCYRFNAVKNFIRFDNGSEINLIEVKYKPSDPLYEDVGSTEYTGGWFEEIGEINKKAVSVLQTRVGRHLNGKYGLKGIIFMTCNPKQNWAKDEFYDKHVSGLLEIENKESGNLTKKYLNCLVTENPFIEQGYIDSLRKQATNDKSMYERLFKGNWDYEDNPNQLCDQEMVESIYDNDHVSTGKGYITVDVARLGADKTVIAVWSGWRLVELLSYDISKITKIQDVVYQLRRKYHIPKVRCIADEDGVGGGLVDNTGILGFNNNGRALKERGVYGDKSDVPSYRNIQVQCLYHLSDIVNKGDIWIKADISTNEKKYIKQELSQIISKSSDYGKLDLKPKSEIKKDIGRSPDYRDCLLMRVFFDLKPSKNNYIGVKKRGLL